MYVTSHHAGAVPISFEAFQCLSVFERRVLQQESNKVVQKANDTIDEETETQTEDDD